MPEIKYYKGYDVIEDDYSEDSYSSNKVKLGSSRYGCRLHNERRQQWEKMNSDVRIYKKEELVSELR